MEKRNARVVVVDDDAGVLRAVTRLLTQAGYDTVSMSDPVEALTLAKDPSVDVVVSDIRMPNLSGLQLLKAFKEAQPEVEVIIMTGHATVETALEAVKAGAYDYLMKPFDRIEDFTVVVEKAVERRMLKKRNVQLEAQLSTRSEFEGIVGQSSQMQAIYKMVESVAPSTATVLVRGESGTGKELIARAIHYRSARRDKPFLTVNCSALTETLLDSELFGHQKGAFTGALTQKRGLFEAATGGTLFLDEIGDISLATQVRLLRALQEGEIKRVGATDSIHVDVRVVAATNVNLEEAIKEGKFREDLYYRLNVISLQLPPLRERPTDVPLLATHFLQHYAKKQGKSVAAFSPEALEKLTLYAWPGNVRELQNCVERSVVLTRGTSVTAEDLPPVLMNPSKSAGTDDVTSLTHLPFAQAKSLTIAAFERRYLTTLLEKCGDNVTQAAVAAGMDRSNFRRLLKDHGIGGRGHKGEDGKSEG